jgi:hypothetical protein
MMKPHNGISATDVEALRRFDPCTISNAIELLNIRPAERRIPAGSTNLLQVSSYSGALSPRRIIALESSMSSIPTTASS